MFPKNALLIVQAGSHAYGTNTVDSDNDYRGIIPASRGMLVGLASWNDQFETKDPDVVLYTLPKFIKLALDANPNILDALFSPDDCIIKSTPTAQQLQKMAHLFLSKRVFHTFGGYAHHQLAKLRNPGGRHGAHQARIKKYGYDTKHASHVVRLYRMGYEILTEGIVRVRRPDAKELLAIKHGAWTIAQVEHFAAEMKDKMNDAYRHTALPDEPDTDRIVSWLMTVQEMMLRR
jgi:hypothetical protein